MSEQELPAGWVEVPLADIAHAQLGKMLDKAKRTAGTALPYLRNVNVRWGEFNLSDLLEMPFTDDELDRYGLRDGDVLICEGGEPGRAAVWRGGNTPIKFQKALHRVRLYGGCDPRWLVFQLRKDATGNRLSSFIIGTTIKHFTGEALGRYPIALPPLPELRRIVEKIEALTARSRRAREALDALPALIDRYRQSILAAAFRGDLTADWRVQHQRTDTKATRAALLGERQRVWAERRRRRYSPPVPLEFDDLAPLPKQWFWSTADECTWELTVGHVGPMKDRYVASGVPFLRSQNVRENRFDPKELRFIPEEFHRELGKSVLRPGDVVVVRSGAPGVACVVPDELSEANCADVVICRFLPSLKPRLLSYYINSMSARRMIFGMQVGVAQQHFNVGAMARLPVPVIPLDEQEVLLSFLDRAFHSIAEMEKRLLAQENRLSTLDQSILAKAFRGELVPQDPNDEPASVLLERIRAERAAAGVAPRRGRRVRTE